VGIYYIKRNVTIRTVVISFSLIWYEYIF